MDRDNDGEALMFWPAGYLFALIMIVIGVCAYKIGEW